MECVICGRQLPENSEICPYCGTHFSAPQEIPERQNTRHRPEKPRKLPVLLGVMSALLLLLTAGYFLTVRVLLPARSDRTETHGEASETTAGAPAETVPHYHSFAVTLQREPACETNGMLQLQCACGETRLETVQAAGHVFSGADCTRAAVCSLCGKEDSAPLGHAVEEGICTRCGLLQITLEELQGTWRKQVGDGYVSITVSGSSAAVYESYLNSPAWYGTVALTSDGFIISGTYAYYDSADTRKTNSIRLHCPVARLTDDFIEEAPWASMWYRQK